jgi:hypothetical protein
MMFNYFFDVLLPIKMMFSTMNNVYPLSDVADGKEGRAG